MTATLTDLERAIKHRYVYEPGGKPGVNVTTLTGLIDDGKSGAFAGAAVKITKAGGDYRAEWRAKAERGTRVHSHLESWLRNESAEVLDDDKGPVDALERFFLDHKPEMIEVEPIVLSAKGYGGRLDCIVRIGDEVALIDAKTGNSYPLEHRWQLTAYRHADGIAVYDDAGMLTGLRPLPAIDWCAALYLHDDGTYDLVRYEADEESFAMFCDLLRIYQWIKRTKA